MLSVVVRAEKRSDQRPLERRDDDDDDDDEIEKDSSNKPAAKPAAAEKDWWTAEGLSAEESLAVVAERVAEAEKAYETAREDKDDRTKFSAGIASNAQEAKELAQARRFPSYIIANPPASG